MAKHIPIRYAGHLDVVWLDRVRVYYVHVYDGVSAYPVGYFGGATPNEAIYNARLSFPYIDIDNPDAPEAR